MYMGRYAPKERKNREKVTFYFSIHRNCNLNLSKKNIGISPAYAYVRAPSNSDVDFLLSQVSQVEYFWGKKTR